MTRTWGKLLAATAGTMLCISGTIGAQDVKGRAADTADLRVEVLRADAAMFAAFNAHDLAGLMRWFSANLEFYHDRAGLQRYAEVRAGFGDLFARNDGMRRELIEGSVKVYPIPRYGAIEVGTHRFCHVEAGREVCGSFAFLHIWRHEGATWRVTRVVSYGH